MGETQSRLAHIPYEELFGEITDPIPAHIRVLVASALIEFDEYKWFLIEGSP